MKKTQELNLKKFKTEPFGFIMFKYKLEPPTWEDITLNGEFFEESIVPPAFCSNSSDIPKNQRAKELQLRSSNAKDLIDFTGRFQLDGIANWVLIAKTIESNGLTVNKENILQCSKLLTPIYLPPSVDKVKNWIKLKVSNHKQQVSEENENIHQPTHSNSGLCTENSDDFIPVTPEVEHKILKHCSFKTSTPAISGKRRRTVKRLSNIFSKTSESVFNKRKRQLKFLAMKDIQQVINLSGGSEKDLFHDSIDEDVTDLSEPPTSNLRLAAEEEIELRKNKEISFQVQTMNSNFREIVYSPSPSRISFSRNIMGVTANDTFGFQYASQNLAEANKLNEFQFLTVMCLECLTSSRPNFEPDPTVDQILALFFIVTLDYPEEVGQSNKIKGMIMTSGSEPSLSTSLDMPVLLVENETELLEELLNVVAAWDPDIFLGYEVQKKSWGYLLERAASLGTDMSQRLSRVPEHRGSHFEQDLDEYGFAHTHQLHISGRIILNLWRLLKSEVTVTSYTFENVVYHVLHQRVPEYPNDKIFSWWNLPLKRWRVIQYYTRRCEFSLMLCERLDLVRRTSELARLFGIQFYEVLSRGTQIRVESMMLRLTRLSNMVAVSPSVQQRTAMNAPEWLALNMEPESRFYTDPVLVLDFQSLYPSVMIAHNYCFSTCLGKVSLLAEDDQPFKFGAGSLSVSPEELLEMVDQLSISPCGVAFVPKSVREGILPKMLNEILTTRLMVKRAMKVHKEDPLLQRILHSRQLGLKLIANVTYGYTSANFSGRMPCVEVGDSVVSKGREILERAILMVNSNPKWGGRVVYGDTDSMFVHLIGASKERAFAIGQEIARKVTDINPKPIKLKFEKVYLPCILQTKKRYAGYMYETPEQKEPVFDAKGIETVRRDGCPASSKLLEKSLKILFDTSNISMVKAYVRKQLLKLMQGKLSMEDLIFAKEFRGLQGYRPGACVPSLALTRQWCRLDHRKEPLIGERVPYVIIYGAPRLPLIKLVRSPHALLVDSSLRINYQYYACKALLPPLHRCFVLLSMDVFSWLSDLPKAPCDDLILECISTAQTESIARFFTLATCSVCGEQTTQRRTGKSLSLCNRCVSQPKKTVLHLVDRIQLLERTVDDIGKICSSCMSVAIKEIDCVSLDCPITYRLSRAVLRMQLVPKLKETIDMF